METIRDSAFGKLVRVFTGKRWLRYPEEIDPSLWTECLRPVPSVKDEEAATLADTEADSWGLYAVMSQASRVSRRLNSIAETEGVDNATPLLIDWRGAEDSENPQNWSTTKKFLVSCQIWLLTFAIYIGSAIYTPGIEGVSQQFGVSRVAATLGLTLFVLGYGLGPMVWSPLSELPTVGRSPTYVLTLLVFVFFQFAVIYAKNFGMLLAFRFLTGFIGSPALATGGASMGDIWNPQVRDYMIAIWGCFAISAPVLGPLVGGFASAAKGWTWTIWQLLWVSGFTLVLLFFFLPETFAPNILYRRARRIRKITGNSNYKCEAEIELSNVRPKDILFEALIRPFQLSFLEPIVLFLNLYISLIYGILYIWFEAFPIVFSEIHTFNPGQTGLAFLGILIGSFITLAGYFYWKAKYQSRHFDRTGNISPEHQLPPACVVCG
ncbi:hypothetical protein BBP40_001927 [Aspergillus hancockii]|nr:hypothetical protein BBP40_001927 [Aspergillus hancockii]